MATIKLAAHLSFYDCFRRRFEDMSWLHVLEVAGRKIRWDVGWVGAGKLDGMAIWRHDNVPSLHAGDRMSVRVTDSLHGSSPRQWSALSSHLSYFKVGRGSSSPNGPWHLQHLAAQTSPYGTHQAPYNHSIQHCSTPGEDLQLYKDYHGSQKPDGVTLDEGNFQCAGNTTHASEVLLS
jgi:hypothetical protein